MNSSNNRPRRKRGKPTSSDNNDGGLTFCLVENATILTPVRPYTIRAKKQTPTSRRPLGPLTT